METKVTTLAEALADKLVPESGTKEKLEYIDIDDVRPDPRNFYELSDIDELAANIDLFGVQQPLRVRDDPTDPDKVILISGHRRRAAVAKLVQEGREDLRALPCIRERDAGSEALQELRLIYANSDTRRMTSAEISKQAERVEALLYQLKEEGYEFPGRMRDHVAEACKVSKSKLARLKVIREGLRTEWLALWGQGVLAEETAYQLSRMKPEHQAIAYRKATYKNRRPENFYASEAENLSRRLTDLEEHCPACSKISPPGPCPHLRTMQERYVSENSWDINCQYGRCCLRCDFISSCKAHCRAADDRKANIRQEQKEANARRKAEETKRDEPLRARNQVLWARIGEAMASAGKTVEELFAVQVRYYSDTVEQDFRKKAVPETGAHLYESPFGTGIHASDINRMIATADLLGVTLDWLLGRTEA